MNLSELNLDINTYTDARLQKNFGLPDNYTKEDVVLATSRLATVASETLEPDDETAFNGFLRAAEERLLKKKMVEVSSMAWNDNMGYSDTNDLLPSNRSLTVIPDQAATQIQTRSNATGNMSSGAQLELPGRDLEQSSATSEDAATTVIQLPVPPQPQIDRLPKTNTHHKNIASRIILIDSQYRQHISSDRQNAETTDLKNPKPSFNTDFTLDLSEPLKKVVSLKLYSIQIPTTWYTFDDHLGNTVYKIQSGTQILSPGNYSIDELKTKLSNSITIDSNKNKTKIDTNSLYFFKEGGYTFNNGIKDIKGGQYINQNLGWNLGFRPTESDQEFVINTESDATFDVYGPKYFTLALDDFNQNHQNKGLVSLTDNHGPLSAVKTSTKYDGGKALTKAQKYSDNQKIEARKDDVHANDIYKAPGPRSTTDAFAMVPLKGIIELRERNEPFVEYGPSLQSNVRTYSSPVDIERLRVRLFDDKGNLVNLHDNDWSFSLIVEQEI